MKCTAAGWMVALLALAPTGRAQHLVDLTWTPSSQSVAVGEVVEVRLVASSDGAAAQALGALDAILDWDPAVLQLLGKDDTGAGYGWFVSGFLPDTDGINLDWTDGDAIYTALASPALPAFAPPPPGLLVTTMRFQALAPSAGSTLRFTPMLGSFGRTRVIDFFNPGLEITGDLTSEATIAVTGGSPFQAVCFGDGSGAPCGCGNELPGTQGGCGNGLGTGAVLSASGDPDITADTLVLTASLITAQPGLMFQGSNAIAGGDGVTFGDGLRCCGQSVVRLQVLTGSQPAPTTVSTTVTISQRPLQDTPAMPGTTFCYQFWYRTPGGLGLCGSGFNFSNALQVLWS